MACVFMDISSPGQNVLTCGSGRTNYFQHFQRASTIAFINFHGSSLIFSVQLHKEQFFVLEKLLSDFANFVCAQGTILLQSSSAVRPMYVSVQYLTLGTGDRIHTCRFKCNSLQS
uniref:Uncharacterized protein n=1 Tax=Eutreptiella gymnastica TaxID=73025 RepID=A0A7S1JAS9_9EUGL|mmetsp:Transcript_79055/g.139629  ORF Transcript_79055/g.139629 Transcript_79055/m.139629 type:complete len:115 (+) Transcript_79055:1227-1571(+)